MSFSTTTTHVSPRCLRLRATPRVERRFTAHTRRERAQWVTNGIRGVQNFDGRFELAEEAEASLHEMLKSETFAKLVVKECKLQDDVQCEFTGLLFQPVPWSPNTTKGMPQEFEKYLEDPEYMIVNVPPTVMFKAKIFDPSRLCAIYKKTTV